MTNWKEHQEVERMDRELARSSAERPNRTFYLVEVQHDELTRPYSLDADVIKSVLVEGTNVHRSRPVIGLVAEVDGSAVLASGAVEQTTYGPGWPD